jgi:two-component system NarL family response regulator
MSYTSLKRPIRVLVVGDHIFSRIGVTVALNAERDIGVVAETDCGSSAVDLFRHHHPDVAVLDLSLHEKRALDVSRQIIKTSRSARILLSSADENEEKIKLAVSVGIRGYVPISATCKDLIHAVRRLAAGSSCFIGAVTEKTRHDRSHVKLSSREQEVLQGIAHGMANKAIAAEIKISVETVKTYVCRIMSKLGVRDRTSAVIEGIKRGLIRLNG